MYIEFQACAIKTASSPLSRPFISAVVVFMATDMIVDLRHVMTSRDNDVTTRRSSSSCHRRWMRADDDVKRGGQTDSGNKTTVTALAEITEQESQLSLSSTRGATISSIEICSRITAMPCVKLRWDKITSSWKNFYVICLHEAKTESLSLLPHLIHHPSA